MTTACLDGREEYTRFLCTSLSSQGKLNNSTGCSYSDNNWRVFVSICDRRETINERSPSRYPLKKKERR
jgi:hypothetical protein